MAPVHVKYKSDVLEVQFCSIYKVLNSMVLKNSLNIQKFKIHLYSVVLALIKYTSYTLPLYIIVLSHYT